jgi:hypothetical protein
MHCSAASTPEPSPSDLGWRVDDVSLTTHAQPPLKMLATSNTVRYAKFPPVPPCRVFYIRSISYVHATFMHITQSFLDA